MTLLSLSFVLSFFGPTTSFSATTPSLGETASYGVLGSTYTNTTTTTINGSVGFTTGPATAPLGVHTNYGSGAPYATAGTDQGTALSALNVQPCTFTFAAGAIDLSTDTTHGATGVYVPGVYCSTGAMDIGGPLTLNGSGTYIFRPVGALTTTAGSITTLSGAVACDVFWTPTQATTIAANTTFMGTVIAAAGITVGANTTWSGRALAFGGTVTTDTDTITVPTCVIPPTVLPVEIGGVYSVPWIAPIISVLKVPTPLALPLGSGSVTYDYTVTNIGLVEMNNIKVVDDKCSPVFYLSGDVNADAILAINGAWKYRCTTNLTQTTTNTVTATGHAYFFTAIDTANTTVVVGSSTTPPLINIVKTANVYTLPASGGNVTYLYTITNPGVAPLNNVSVTDDKCTGLPGRVIGNSGDLNGNNLLENTESWSFSCKTQITKTTTNTATAIGYANGLSATDFALATVVVLQVVGVTAGFPNSGIPQNPLENSQISWSALIILVGIISVLSTAVVLNRKNSI